jgi:hypothetical protein
MKIKKEKPSIKLNSENYNSKKIYIISGKNILNTQNKNKEESLISFYSSTPINKLKKTNFILPSLKSTDYSLKNKLYNKSRLPKFYSFDNTNYNNTFTCFKNSSSSISLSKEKFKYKVNILKKPKLLIKSTQNLILSIEEEKKKFEKEKNINKNKKIFQKIKSPFLFRKLLPINITNLLDENKDIMKDLNIHKEKWHKNVRTALLNDINNTFPKGFFYQKFYLELENRMNFFFDVCLFPHLKNNLMFLHKRLDTKELRRENLCNFNFFSKDIEISLNKRRIKLIFEKEEEKLNELKKRKEKKKEEFQGLDNKFELEDFFNKKIDVCNISFASKKDREFVYSQKVNIAVYYYK